MSRRYRNAGWMAGLTLAGISLGTSLAGACAQTTPAVVPVPTPQANKAPGQNDQPVVAPAPQRHQDATSVGTIAIRPGKLEPPVTAAPGVVVDQVIGVVNGDLILESDIDEERRFESFEPFSTPGGFDRDRAIARLTDRTLILQQAKLQPEKGVTMEDVRKQLQSLRKDLPACKQYHCETDAGWNKFVHDKGFTMDEFEARWQQRMEILKFIEMRFRAGIEITPDQIKAYYDTKMLPEYAKVKSTPPKLAVISDRIQEILLEDQVSALLSDWLESLKAQGAVRMMRPGEVQP